MTKLSKFYILMNLLDLCGAERSISWISIECHRTRMTAKNKSLKSRWINVYLYRHRPQTQKWRKISHWLSHTVVCYTRCTRIRRVYNGLYWSIALELIHSFSCSTLFILLFTFSFSFFFLFNSIESDST